MPCPTVQEVRNAINMGLPLMEMIAARTTNKADDLLVAILKVVNGSDDIAQKVCDVLGHEHTP